jgi:hypothetical protein
VLVVPWPPGGGCPLGGRPWNVTPHFCSAARSFWNCAEPGRRFCGPGGPPLPPRGRLGIVTPAFFRHATT